MQREIRPESSSWNDQQTQIMTAKSGDTAKSFSLEGNIYPKRSEPLIVQAHSRRFPVSVLRV
jgi:hypothetical protein